ncbi:MAG: TonB-dependent hemoglobin/transferrin/lactoferrin family receptor [Xanthomonadales bacterium]|nr:TonB-dependent hemoglobin/transferrin/lactoferrin family receptor [Xanthomonadales bacterium]
MNFKLVNGLTFAVCCSFLALPQAPRAGQELAEADAAIVLDPIVVVASKRPQALSTIAAQVTVIDAEQISQNLVEDINGLLRYEPGLEVETAGTRFGATAINIRGIGGNRVAIEQDGIPVRDQVVVGAFSNGGRALLETDRIKRVEVLHGPASVLYGSNALGGIISVTSWDPEDLLAITQGKVAVRVRGGYQGVNDNWVGSGIAAWGEGSHGLLVAATWREGHERDNTAPADAATDPQDWDSQDFMLRYTFDSAAGNRLRLTARSQERDIDTEIQSQLGYGRRFGTTTELLGFDHDENQLLAADYEFAFGGWEQGVVRLFHTDYETDQYTFETRANARTPVKIHRRFYYQQQHDGMNLNLFRSLISGATTHELSLGMEWLQTQSGEFRDGSQTNLLTGQSSNVILGEQMPVRDFPNSRSRELGFYIQDEISFANSRWELVPALRWDHYELKPQVDKIWQEDYPDFTVTDVSDSQFTPRLAALYRMSSVGSLYGQYSAGFRAPPFEDVNIGLFIPLFGYRAIPNPDLQAETSNGFELGSRWITGHSQLSLALFYTDYDDFIESRALIGIEPQTGELIFQSRNIDQARIYGLDIRYEQDLAAWNEKLQGWYLKAAAYWSEGDNRQNDQPLNSIAPPQAVIGTSWYSHDERWNMELTGTLTAAKKTEETDQNIAPRYATDAWFSLDFAAGWRPVADLQIRAGIFNLTNESYWHWLDVANLEAGNPMIPILSQPGRSYSFSISFEF